MRAIWHRDMAAAKRQTELAIKAVRTLLLNGANAVELDDIENDEGQSDRDKVLADAAGAVEIIGIARRLLDHSAVAYGSLHMPGRLA